MLTGPPPKFHGTRDILPHEGRRPLKKQGGPVVLETVTGHGTLDEIQQTLELLWDRHPEVSARARMHMELAACEIGANI